MKENIESSRIYFLGVEIKIINYLIDSVEATEVPQWYPIFLTSSMQPFFPVKNRQMVTLPQRNFWRKFPFFPKRIRQTSPFFFGGGSPHCRLSASYSFNNPVQKSDWNLVTLSQDPPINMESKWETSNSKQPGLILVTGTPCGGPEEHDLFLCPFVTHFWVCPFGWELGPPFLSFIFPPLLSALFNGVCQGFNQPFYLINQQ